MEVGKASDNFNQEIWNAFINPFRATEASAYIKSRPETVAQMRGERGESALHWGVLTSVTLLVDLIDIGISVNNKDADGKTPMDWLHDRLWNVCIEKSVNLREGGRIAIREQTEPLIQALWAFGGRVSNMATVHPAQIWARAGLWALCREMVHFSGPEAASTLGASGESILHGWVLAPESQKKYKFAGYALEAGMDFSVTDANGRSPLWYAIKALQESPHMAYVVWPAMEYMLSKGALVDQKDTGGVSPRKLAEIVSSDLSKDASQKLASILAKAKPENG